MSFEGIDIRESGDKLLFDALLQDLAKSPVTTGTTSLYLYELQADGSLKSYDFDDDTFKATALTTETASMTHRTGNNGTTNTGLWTYALTTVTGFTPGGIYYARVKHGTEEVDDFRKFQYGGLARLGPHSKSIKTIATGHLVWYDEDGATELVEMAPSEDSGEITVAPMV